MRGAAVMRGVADAAFGTLEVAVTVGMVFWGDTHTRIFCERANGTSTTGTEPWWREVCGAVYPVYGFVYVPAMQGSV